MKVFVFGANGMLGNYVSTYLNTFKIIKITRKDYDISSSNAIVLENLLLDKGLREGDVVINCAGVIPQSSPSAIKNYYIVNGLFPNIISMICNYHNVNMIHITTDCVFSGEDGNYNENSVHDETNDYGLSKSLGDLANCCIIRTSIIGEEIENKKSLLEWVRSNKNGKINGYINHVWNGVTCLQLAKVIHRIIDEKKYWKGPRHIFSNSVSKYELVCMINEIYNLNITIDKLETNKIDKTLSTIFDRIEVPDIYQQLEELQKFKLL